MCQLRYILMKHIYIYIRAYVYIKRKQGNSAQNPEVVYFGRRVVALNPTKRARCRGTSSPVPPFHLSRKKKSPKKKRSIRA